MNTTDKPVKKYRAIKEIISSNPVSERKCHIGTESVYEHPYYVFPYHYPNGDTHKFGLDGKAFMISNPEHYPDWFEEVTGDKKQPTDTPKQERIEVTYFGLDRQYQIGSNPEHILPNYLLVLSNTIHKDKFNEIKQAIESVLNDAAPINGCIKDEYDAPPLYTQEQVNTIREETWRGARKLESGIAITGYMGEGLKYKTLEDFLIPPNPTPLSNTKEQVPLFTTEDGVKITDPRTMVFGVTDNFEIVWSHGATVNAKLQHRHFSTIELAKQYIFENKPCLSLNDLLEVWGTPLVSYKNAPLYKNFEEKAKQKLSQ